VLFNYGGVLDSHLYYFKIGSVQRKNQKSSNSPPKGLVKGLKRAGGVALFYSLLQKEEEKVRVLAIQLIDVFLKQAANAQLKIPLGVGQLQQLQPLQQLGFEFDDRFEELDSVDWILADC